MKDVHKTKRLTRRGIFELSSALLQRQVFWQAPAQ